MPTSGSVTGLIVPAVSWPPLPESPSLAPELWGLQYAFAEAARSAMSTEPDLLAVIDCLGPVAGALPSVAGGRHLTSGDSRQARLFPVDRAASARLREALAALGLEAHDVRLGADRASSPVASEVASTLSFLTADAPHLPVVSITLPDVGQALDGSLGRVGRALRASQRHRRLVAVFALGGPLGPQGAKGRPDAALTRAVRQALFPRTAGVAMTVTSVVWDGRRYVTATLIRSHERARAAVGTPIFA